MTLISISHDVDDWILQDIACRCCSMETKKDLQYVANEGKKKTANWYILAANSLGEILLLYFVVVIAAAAAAAEKI